MSSTHTPYDGPNWLAPSSHIYFPADGQTQLDFNMEGPWFLTGCGLMSRDCSSAHNEMEWLPGETRHGSDQADFPVYSVGSFGMALKYLPRVSCLQRNYKRQLDGSFQCTDIVYFVVENHNRLFADSWDAARFYLSLGDPWLSIQVAPTREHANRIIAKATSA